ncbi:MAG TPA: trehalose-phosphatase [Actinomycetota bacterium]|nr:trehalose-phosphatase [Actinomycetota bacterium]
MDALDPIRSQPRRAGIFTDFDGTLSEIAPTPGEAVAVPGARETLEALAGMYDLVAVVSGRRAADVAALLGRPAGVRWFGLYGLEVGGGPVDPMAEALLERVTELLPEVEAVAALVPGAIVEPKGLQVAVHYRAASDPDGAARLLRGRLHPIADRAGLKLLEGKKVLELAPERGSTKGDVVERTTRARDHRAILYAGDDLADREAFAAVERLRAEGVAGVTIAVRSAETPEELVDRADLVVDGASELVRVMGTLT